MSLRAAAIAGLVAAAPPAQAGPWIGVGVSEVVTVPDVEHAGLYGFASLTWPIETAHVYVIPGAGIEISPDLGRGGAIASLTVERMLSATVAADLIASFIHDQPGLDWGESLFSLGLGAGASITIGRVVVSPAIYAYRTLDVDGWTAAPTLTVSTAL